MNTSRIAAIATASPSLTIAQEEGREFLLKHYSAKLNRRSLAIIRKAFSSPSILRRHFAFDDPNVLLEESADSRINRFSEWAIKLSEEAIRDVLKKLNLEPRMISGLVVNTCTGYLCPGLTSYLIERLDLPRHIPAYDLVGGGCGGAIPNLQVCQGLLQNYPDGRILSVSVEICSTTFQMGDEMSLLVSNALFADAASATVLWNQPIGLKLVSSASRLFPEFRDDIRFIYKNGQLHNQLTTRLPKVIAQPVGQLIRDLLAAKGLQVKDVQHWAFHSGGETIIEAMETELQFSDHQLKTTRQILSEYGNMSSPTVMFALKEIMENPLLPGEWCLMVSFGAGFSAHAFLLQV